MDRTVNDETSLSVHAPSGSASVSPFSGPHLTLSLADAASSAPLAIEDGVLESVEEQLKTLSNSLFSACAKGDAPAVSAAIVEMTQNYGGAFAVDLPSDGGRCPVEVAILGAHCDVIDVLVNAKASLVLQDGRSVLDIAIEADRPGVLAHLLQMHCEASRTRTTSDTQWLVEDLEVSSKTRGMQPNEVVDDPTMRPDAGQVEHGAASASNNALRRSPGAALGSRTSKIAELKGARLARAIEKQLVQHEFTELEIARREIAEKQVAEQEIQQGSSKICFSWRNNGFCQFGESCAFSHGSSAFTDFDTKAMMGNILNDIREEKARKAKELFEREVVAGLRCALCGKSMPCEHIRKVQEWIRTVSGRHKDQNSSLIARLECNVGLPFPTDLLNGALVLAVSQFQPPSEQDTASGTTVLADDDYDDFDLDAADEARSQAGEVARAAAVARSCALLDVLLERNLPLDPNFKLALPIFGNKALSCLQVAASQRVPGTAFDGNGPLGDKENPCIGARAHHAMVDRLLSLKASVDDPVRLDRSDNKIVSSNTEEATHSHDRDFAAPKEHRHEGDNQFRDTLSSSSRTNTERTEIFEGDTPLLLAIRVGNDTLAKALIDLHASIMVENGRRENALDVARKRRVAGLMDFLRSAFQSAQERRRKQCALDKQHFRSRNRQRASLYQQLIGSRLHDAANVARLSREDNNAALSKVSAWSTTGPIPMVSSSYYNRKQARYQVPKAFFHAHMKGGRAAAAREKAAAEETAAAEAAAREAEARAKMEQVENERRARAQRRARLMQGTAAAKAQRKSKNDVSATKPSKPSKPSPRLKPGQQDSHGKLVSKGKVQSVNGRQSRYAGRRPTSAADALVYMGPGSRAHSSSELVRRSQAPSAPTSTPVGRARPLTGGHEQHEFENQQNPSSRPGSSPSSLSTFDEQIGCADKNPSARIGRMGLALLGAISESESVREPDVTKVRKSRQARNESRSQEHDARPSRSISRTVSLPKIKP